MFEGLGDLLFYNEDIDIVMEVLVLVSVLWEVVFDVYVVLVVMLEYNGSILVVIKNVIDWLFRLFGDGVLKDKLLVVIGGFMGCYGGVWVYDEICKLFSIVGMWVVDVIKLLVLF